MRTVERIAWPDHCRGVAAVVVAFSHCVHGRHELLDEGIVALLGQSAVGVFFILSGFVVPYALLRMSPVEFLVSRFVRLWPVFVVSLALGLWCLHVRTASVGAPFPLSAVDVGGNLLLGLRDLLGLGEVDAVVWTLEAEVRAYLVGVCCLTAFRIGDPFVVVHLLRCLVIAACVLGWWAFLDLPGQGTAAELLRDGHVFALMLVGVSFHLRQRGLISRRRLCGLVALSCLAGGACLVVAPWGPFAVVLAIASLMSLAIAGTLFALGDHLRPVAVLSGLSAVSYSVYLVHRPAGLLVVESFERSGVDGWPAVLTGTVVGIALGIAVWRFVERPCHNAAGFLGRAAATRYARALSHSET